MSYDILLENGDLPKRTTHVSGAQAIAQRVQIRLNRWRGEWFADQREGVPWLTWKQDPAPDLLIITTQIRAEIRNTPGVIAVPVLDVDFTDGQIIGSGTVVLDGGEDRTIEAEIYGPAGNSQPVGILIL